MSSLLGSRNAKIGAGVAGGLLVLAAAWFLLIAPQRSKASELDAQISTSQAELTQRRQAVAHPSAKMTVKPGDMFRLTKALPNDVDMPGILLDLSRLSARNKLDFQSVSPSPAVTGTGFVQQPVAVVVEGRFGSISRFLGDLRTLVAVRGGRLDSRGRLYTVSGVDMSAPGSGKQFPIVQAKVTVNAFTFSAPVPTQAPTDGSSTTADTSSTSGTVAAGATP